MNKIDVVGLGALNVDQIYKVDRILVDGEATAKEFTLSPGGSAANTIYGLARLGVKTGFSGVVGDDAEGKLLLTDFQKVGVDTSGIKIKARTKTGTVLCLSDSSGKRSLYVLPGANNLLTMDDLDLDYINQASILHLSSFAGDKQFEVCLELIGKLAQSVKLSFAPGALYVARGLKALAPLLKKTHVLFVNASEMQQLTGKDFAAGAKTCLTHGCQIVAVTLGKGIKRNSTIVTSYIRDSQNEHIIEPSNDIGKSALDTTGAGDAFAAGFLYGLLNNKDPQTCGRLGDTVARFSITRIGARQGLPTLNELSQRYRELYHKEL